MSEDWISGRKNRLADDVGKDLADIIDMYDNFIYIVNETGESALHQLDNTATHILF